VGGGGGGGGGEGGGGWPESTPVSDRKRTGPERTSERSHTESCIWGIDRVDELHGPTTEALDHFKNGPSNEKRIERKTTEFASRAAKKWSPWMFRQTPQAAHRPRQIGGCVLPTLAARTMGEGDRRKGVNISVWQEGYMGGRQLSANPGGRRKKKKNGGWTVPTKDWREQSVNPSYWAPKTRRKKRPKCNVRAGHGPGKIP